MALETARRRRGRLSLTSLIDVIFLLLLFFMLSSTFSKFGEIELTGAGSAGRVPDRPVLFLRVGAEALMLNGQPTGAEALPGALAALAAGEERIVLVSLAGDVSAQRLVDVLALLRAVPGLHPTVLG